MITQREALLAAADQIERVPTSYQFQNGGLPSYYRSMGCKDSSCALGWVADLSGAADTHSYRDGAEFLDVPVYEFYHRMEDLTGTPKDGITDYQFFKTGWYIDATLCVKGLRLYADKYHPAPIRSDKELVQELISKLEIPEGVTA